MEGCLSGIADPPLVRFHQTVSVLTGLRRSTSSDVSLTANVSQPGESSREGTSKVGTSVFGKDHLADVRLQSANFSVGFTNTAEVHSGVTITGAFPAGPAHFVKADANTLVIPGQPTLLAQDTPPFVVIPSQDISSSMLYGTPSLSATSSVAVGCLDVPISFRPQTSPTPSAPRQGVFETIKTNHSSLSEGLQQPDHCGPTFQNVPVGRIAEQVHGMQTILRSAGPEDSPSVQTMLTDAPPDKTACYELMGDDWESGAFNSESFAGPSVATVGTAPLPISLGMHSPIMGSTRPDSSDPTQESVHGKPFTATSLEAEILNRSLLTSESLLDRTRLGCQVVGLAEQYPRPIPQQIPQTVDTPTTLTAGEPISSVTNGVTQHDGEHVHPVAGDTITPVTETSDPTPAEDLAVRSVEELGFPVIKGLITAPNIPRPPQHPPSRRFFLSSFQRPTLLDALVRRLQKKRALLHSWRAGDQCPGEQGAPPIRPILETLTPSQIFEYIKSGGKSISAPPDLAKDKVKFPLLGDMAWLTVSRCHPRVENHC